ncbi:Type-1 restriction enzyme MjaXIP specificity protein [uncultured archaeon]|nr:Type-1 restriction enzyme MjaXIP specificity protein [uncultured archaeon]
MKKLPDGWKFVKLSDITDILAGGTPRRNVQEYWNVGVIPWLKISDLKNTYINYAEEKITQKGLDDSSAKIFPKGTIVYSIFATLGAVGILDISAATNQAIAGIIPNNSLIETKYLYYCLQSEKNNILSKKSHATQDNINLTILRNHEIPLPPLPTQKKIAAVLEKAETLREWRKEADGLTDRFLKSTFLEIFGDPVENPKGWEYKKLMELGNWQSGGTPSRSNGDYFKGYIPWYTAGELNSLFVCDSIEKITQDAIKESSAKLISPNNLLLGMYDTAALKSSITTVECACNQAIVFSKLEFEFANIFYLYYVIHVARKHYMRQQRGVRQKNLNLSMIRNLEVPIPPIELQNKFASIVHQVEQIRQYQEQSKQQIDHFFNVLMQRAFHGELEAE